MYPLYGDPHIDLEKRFVSYLLTLCIKIGGKICIKIITSFNIWMSFFNGTLCPDLTTGSMPIVEKNLWLILDDFFPMECMFNLEIRRVKVLSSSLLYLSTAKSEHV